MRRVFHLSQHSGTVAAIGLPMLGMLFGCAVLQAGEYAVLSTGFRLYADRHELAGARVRLFSAEGLTEIPADLILNFEAEETPKSLPVLASTAETVREVKPAEPPKAAALVLPTPLTLAGDAARKYLLPETFVRSVMQVESAFRPEAVSPKGAIGLMQLMPSTARTLQVDPFNPRQNSEGGAAYLRDLLGRYEGDPNQVLLALAAYNAGPGAVERYHGVPPFAETRQYILRVLRAWSRNEANSPEVAPAPAKSGLSESK